MTGSWDGTLIDQDGAIRKFSLVITTPEKQQKSTYYVEKLKVWMKIENKQPLEFHGVLNHGSTSVNLYEKGYEDRNKKSDQCFLRLQLFFENRKLKGYWQETKMSNKNESVCNMGKITFQKKHVSGQV